MNGVGLRGQIEELLGTVDEVARRSVVRLSSHQTIGEAARELEEHDVSGAPVVARNRLVGMVTLKDLFAAAGVPPSIAATSGPWHRYERDLDETGLTVEKVMTRMVLTLPVGTPLAEAASLMRDRGVNRIPILDHDGVVVAILARDDIVEAVARALAKYRRTQRESRSVLGPD